MELRHLSLNPENKRRDGMMKRRGSMAVRCGGVMKVYLPCQKSTGE